jgi:hypothetical protein
MRHETNASTTYDPAKPRCRYYGGATASGHYLGVGARRFKHSIALQRVPIETHNGLISLPAIVAGIGPTFRRKQTEGAAPVISNAQRKPS